MINPERLLTRSLRAHPRGGDLAAIMAAALDAVDPAGAVRRGLAREGDAIVVAGRRYEHVGRVFVVGAGKAGAPMAQAATEILGERVAGGLVVVKEGHAGTENVKLRIENSANDERFSILSSQFNRNISSTCAMITRRNIHIGYTVA